MNIHTILQAKAAAAPSGFINIIMILVLLGLMYFWMIRPQQKRQKELKKFLGELKKGDRVFILSSIHAKIEQIDDTTVTVSLEDGTKMKVEKRAITPDAQPIPGK